MSIAESLTAEKELWSSFFDYARRRAGTLAPPRKRTGFLEDAKGNKSSSYAVAWLCLLMFFAVLIRGMFVGSVEQSKTYQYPPREYAICLTVIILGAFAIEGRTAYAVAKGDAGGYEQAPASETTVTGQQPTINAAPAPEQAAQ